MKVASGLLFLARGESLWTDYSFMFESCKHSCLKHSCLVLFNPLTAMAVANDQHLKCNVIEYPE